MNNYYKQVDLFSDKKVNKKHLWLFVISVIISGVVNFKIIMGLGDYPKEYDAAKHGPYDPARYYGKADTPFGDVKLLELPAWFARREKSVSAFMGVFSRAWWRWQHKYMQPRKLNASPFFQILVFNMAFFYAINYGRMKHHRNYKYH